MKILIDTHILLWFLEDDRRLSRENHNKILKAEAVFVSIASLWECAIKINIERLNLDLQYLIKELKELGIHLLPIEAEHLLEFVNLPLIHRDPFDRLLIAQALEQQIAMVSRDPLIEAYGVARIW